MKKTLEDVAMLDRVAKFIASGENPDGHYVSSVTLLEVVNEIKKVRKVVREEFAEAIKDLILPGDFIDSFKLGIRSAQILVNTKHVQEVKLILEEIKDLDKVPIVNIRGRSVH